MTRSGTDLYKVEVERCLNEINNNTISEGLKISCEWTYVKPYLLNNVDLANLAALQAQLPPTATGYYLLDIGAQIKPPLGSQSYAGEIQDQSFKMKNGVLQMQTIVRDGHFVIPQMPTSDYSQTNPDNLCEETLRRLSGKSTYAYFNTEAHHLELRKDLCLPQPGLQPGVRLLRAKKHLAGIQSEYLYVSKSLSAAVAHEEDLFLPSANILYCGAPKLWTIIDPRSRNNFLSHLVKELKIKPKCHQFLRHLSIVPSPSKLRSWGVQYYTILQPQGCMVLVQPHAIHSVLNLGANIAGAINYADRDWDIPPLYQACEENRCHRAGQSPILVSDFKEGRIRSLTLESRYFVRRTLDLRRGQKQKTVSFPYMSRETNNVLRPIK